MKRELLLLRHGKASKNIVTDDFSRELKDKGKRHAQRIGIWLAQNDLLPDQVLSSPAERARVTAEKCCKAMNMNAADIIYDAQIYQAGIEQLLEAIASSPDDHGRILLVGHNPGLEQLVRFLTASPPDEASMSTTSLAHLMVDTTWDQLGEGTAQLFSMTHSTDLPKGFPFPAVHSDERRDRPAYYYTQSSVIPYRTNSGKIEILLARSSKGKHWVVPKGIAEPGLSLQESAAEEAREEAGAIGEIDQQALGSYDCTKWGATCNVTVYSMRVDHLLPKDQWEESHRGRRWVALTDALTRVKESALQPMILDLEKRLLAD